MRRWNFGERREAQRRHVLLARLFSSSFQLVFSARLFSSSFQLVFSARLFRSSFQSGWINKIGRRIIAQVLFKMRRRTNATSPAGNHVYPGARLLLLGEQKPATLETTLRVRAAAAHLVESLEISK
jgi:hypothetical protein